MDRRFFLALVLTIGVILVTPRLFPGAPRPIAPSVADTTGVASGSAAAATTPTVPSATLAAGRGAVGSSTTPVPVAVPVRTLKLTNALATYEFSTRGAAFTRAELSRYRRLRSDSGDVALADGGRPLVGYRLIAGGDTIALDAADFSASQESVGGKQQLTFTTAVGTGSVRIAYTLADSNYLADVTIDGVGLPAPAFLLIDLPRGFETQEKDSTDDHRQLAYAMRSPAKGAERVNFSKPDPGERLLRQGPFTWAVAKSKYFVVGLLAKDSTTSPLAELQVTGAIRVNKVASRAQATAVSSFGAAPIRLELYAGPQEWKRLVGLGREFEHVNPYGGFLNSVVQPFATIVMRILLWMKMALSLEYGWILVIFGVAVRLLMWPVNSRMMRSQAAMQRVSPLIQAAQTKYKSDPEKQREAVMKVYADAGLSPFSPLLGCLPMLLTMPIFLALFFVFGSTIEFRGVPFLWFPDISVPDPLYIAPLLSGGSMFLTTRLSMRNTPPNPQTQMMGWMMPVVMTVFGFNFASGLNLYWCVQNIASMPQQWLISNERAKKLPVAAPVADAGERKRR